MKIIIIILYFYIFAGFADNKKIGGENNALSEIETIKNCLIEVKSESSKIRRKAVMILGKYNTPEVLNALTITLNDNDKDVRYSAIVSLLEINIIQKNTLLPLFKLLLDSNVHARRLISSSLPKLFRNYIFGNLSKDELKQITKCIIIAFSDSDNVVRMNMINYSDLFMISLPDKLLNNAINDKNRDIRILALKKIKEHKKYQIINNNMVKLAKDKDDIIRNNLSIYLKSMPKSYNLRDALKILIKDKNISIVGNVIIVSLQRNINISLEKIKSVLENPKLDVKIGSNIISLYNWDKSNISFLEKLLNENSAEYKITALQKLSICKFYNFTTKQYKNLLNDENFNIRNYTTIILRHNKFSDYKFIKKFIMSEYIDIRKAIIYLSNNLKESEAEDILMELIFDESDKIRVLVISEIHRRKINNWEDILIQSLEDSNIIISQTAVYSLIGHLKSKKVKKALLIFIKETPHKILSKQIKNILIRK